MVRIVFCTLLAALALGLIAPGGAARAEDADDEDFNAFLADCDHPDVPMSDIDSCLDRARDFAESRPSPQLQSVTARLERRSEEGDGGDAEPAAKSAAMATARAPAAVRAGKADDAGAPLSQETRASGGSGPAGAKEDGAPK